jgi:hypothetical protein
MSERMASHSYVCVESHSLPLNRATVRGILKEFGTAPACSLASFCTVRYGSLVRAFLTRYVLASALVTDRPVLKKVPAAFMASHPTTGVSDVNSNHTMDFVGAQNVNRLTTARATVRLTIGPFIS